MTFVTVRFDDSKVTHADLGKVLGERIRSQDISGEDLSKAFQRFVHRPFLFQEKSNEIQLHEGVQKKEYLHEEVKENEIGVEDIRTSQKTTDNALKIRIDSTVLLFQAFARIAHVLMNQGDEICDDGFLLVETFHCLETVRSIHQIADVDSRVPAERPPEHPRKEIEQRLQQ